MLLTRDRICRDLQDYYRQDVSSAVVDCDYAMHRCRKCGLEFAEPQTPGSSVFYDWITHTAGYYPDSRWEWQKCVEIIMSRKAGGARLLEVGCGSGLFLDKVRNAVGSVLGVDSSENAVTQCRDRGVPARCSRVEDLEKDSGYDYICSFHCLEHIADPSKFLGDVLEQLSPAGVIFFSTPLSPMFFEAVWHDPLNHPPHHITRWRLSSYRALAGSHGLSVDFYFPARRQIREAMENALHLKYFGRFETFSRDRLLERMMQKPAEAMQDLIKLCWRALADRGAFYGCVLVEFRRKR